MIKLKPDHLIVGIVDPSGTQWEKQQDTWIISDGLRKLKEHRIRFSCVHSRHLFENDLSFVQESLLQRNIGLEPMDESDNEKLVENWVSHFQNIGIIEKKEKRRLI
jgi:hypothetical protein